MVIQNRTISVVLTCTQGKTSKEAHKTLLSQPALKLQSYALPGGAHPFPPIEMPLMIIMGQKVLFLHLQFFLASLQTTVLAYHSNYQ